MLLVFIKNIHDNKKFIIHLPPLLLRGHCGHDLMVVQFLLMSRCTRHYMIYVSDLQAGWWFSPVIPVSSTNKTGRHVIIEKLLKMALNTITLTQYFCTGLNHCSDLNLIGTIHINNDLGSFCF